MPNGKSKELGTAPIGKLLVKQAVTASIGTLVMSLNILGDSIFVGNWIGSNASAAISMVLPRESNADLPELFLVSVPHILSS